VSPTLGLQRSRFEQPRRQFNKVGHSQVGLMRRLAERVPASVDNALRMPKDLAPMQSKA